MAFVHRAVDAELLRWTSFVADATQITVYDADFPHEVGQQFVQAVVTNARGQEETFDLTDSNWRELNCAIEDEAETACESVKFVLDLGEPEVVTMSLAIENIYDGDTIHTTADAVAPPPPAEDDEDDYDEWSYAWVYQHTGTGRTEGNSAYFVEVTASSDPTLVGRKFEYGL